MNHGCSQIWVAHSIILSRKGLFSCSQNNNKCISYKTQTNKKKHKLASPVQFRGELWGKQNSVENNCLEPNKLNTSKINITGTTQEQSRLHVLRQPAPENLKNHIRWQLWVVHGMKLSQKGLFSFSQNNNKCVIKIVRKSPVQFRGELWGKQNSVESNHHKSKGCA